MPIKRRVMDAELIEHIETIAERAASALLGGAVGFAVYSLLGVRMTLPQLVACAAGTGVLAYLVSNIMLRSVMPKKERFTVSEFVPREFNAPLADELVLTEADRVEPDELVLADADRLEARELVLTDADRFVQGTEDAAKQPLVLDDILAEIDADSRVVRLFDRKAMPTPGQLKSRIDDHLGKGASRSIVPDASQALSEALAELRRSLR